MWGCFVLFCLKEPGFFFQPARLVSNLLLSATVTRWPLCSPHRHILSPSLQVFLGSSGLRLVIPIHGALHRFYPVFHIHLVFLPLLLRLENHLALPQLLELFLVRPKSNSEASQRGCPQAGHVEVGRSVYLLIYQVWSHLHDESVVTHASICPDVRDGNLDFSLQHVVQLFVPESYWLQYCSDKMVFISGVLQTHKRGTGTGVI